MLPAPQRIGFDPEQRQQPRSGAGDPLAKGIDLEPGRRCVEAAENRERQTVVRARRVDGDVGWRRAAARCGRRPGPSAPAPRSTFARCARRTRRRRSPRGAPRPRRSRGGTPRAWSDGKVRSRLARSPFGSIAMAGIPSMAASSRSERHRPVFPLPVMPTHTAWVTSSRESRRSGWNAGSAAVGQGGAGAALLLASSAGGTTRPR